MKILKLFFPLVLVLAYSNLKADLGCYVPSSGNLYPEKVPGQPNYSSKTVIYMGAACTSDGSSSSTVCFVNGGVGNGFEGDYSPYYCSLDKSTWLLVIAAGVIGYFFISKNTFV